MQAAIYSRKSKYTGRGESIAGQGELCLEYLRLHYGEQTANTALYYEDEGYSGKNLERPAFERMMRDARKGKIQMIVCYRLDRISRNIGDFAKLIEELTAMDIAFISLREQFDTASPMGRAMMYITSVFSQLERETIAQRIRDNMMELAKTGRWLGGVTPFGYRSYLKTCRDANGKTKRWTVLKEEERELKAVKRIFAQYLSCRSLTETAEEVSMKGFLTRQNNRFTPQAVRNILENPVYAAADEEIRSYFEKQCENCFFSQKSSESKGGILVYNRTLQKKGKAAIIRPKEEWVIAEGSHKAAVSGSTWLQIQSILDKNNVSRKKSSRTEALLNGMILCGKCQSTMRPKKTEKGFYYLCTGKEKSKKKLCDVDNLPGDKTDQDVIHWISQIQIDSDLWMNLVVQKSERKWKGTHKKSQVELRTKLDTLMELAAQAKEASAKKYLLEKIEVLTKQLEEEEKICSKKEAPWSAPKSFEELFAHTNKSRIRRFLKENNFSFLWQGKELLITPFTEKKE